MEKLKDAIDEAKLLKEIEDINKEQQHIRDLRDSGKNVELERYLDEYITHKYLVEKAMHNIFAVKQPLTLYENASNAIDFLENLKTVKMLELAKKSKEK